MCVKTHTKHMQHLSICGLPMCLSAAKTCSRDSVTNVDCSVRATVYHFELNWKVWLWAQHLEDFGAEFIQVVVSKAEGGGGVC